MKTIIVVLLQQATSYIRYTQRTPMFFGFVIMVVCVLGGLQVSGSLIWIERILSHFFDKTIEYKFDLSDFLWLFAQVSLVLYILGTALNLLFQYIYKKQLEFNFKLKMKIAFLVALGGYILAGILWKISAVNSIIINKSNISPLVLGLVLVGCFIFTVIMSVYAFVIDAAMNFIDRNVIDVIAKSKEE